MNKILASILVTLFAANVAYAQAPAAPAAPAAAPAAAGCEAKAMDKNGKPLAGAAKASFMKKCEGNSMMAACEAKAIDKNGKPLAGAAKNSFMKKCEAGGAQ
ncbi:MAG TPA: hypothetical protein VF096_00330 [Azonexus sp.]